MIKKPSSALANTETIKGQKGQGGEKGLPGQNGRVTELIYAFTFHSPSELKGGIIPRNWDGEGAPVNPITMRRGESVVYTPDASIWTYLPGSSQSGWLQTGTVNAEIFTLPGEKGVDGDKGHHGEKGVSGADGVNGETGTKGDVGPKGEVGGIGLKGDQGTTGKKGDTGIQGIKGESGAVGLQGLKGDGGLKGAPGLDGTNGSDGVDGEKGTKGQMGVTPGLQTVPVMMVSYDPIVDQAKATYNYAGVKRLGAGHYRFRLKVKSSEGVNSVALITCGAASGSGVYVPQIIRQTDRIIEVKTYNIIEQCYEDALVNVVMYSP